MTWRDVWRRRLARHWLLEPAPAERLTDVVRDVCGIHAQVMSSAELSLGLRVADVGQREVRDALWRDKRLVKTYGARRTVHLLASDDLPLWLAALQAAPPSRPPTRHELEALNPEQAGLVIDAMHDALDGRALTRDELGAALGDHLGAWATEEMWPAFTGMLPRWHLALGIAAHRGLILFGPNQGNRVTYVRTDQWRGPLPRVDGDEALRTIFLRYLNAYGPATEVEFARWLDIPLRAARELRISVADQLDEIDVDGWRAWLPGDESRQNPPPGSSVHLVPQFDCYVVGCHPRQQLIPPEAPPDLQKGTAAPYAVVLVDGVVGGLWSRTRRAKTLDLQVGAFSPFDARQKQHVDAQAARIGAILGVQPSLTYAQVEPRWHM